MKLNKSEILDLFCSSIDNSFCLFKTAKETALNSENSKFPSLGLAELALEELGKSFSCLAIYSKADNLNDWTIFWKEWRNHDLKAHRAFFYEFYCVSRLEIDFEDKVLNFPTNRKNFSKEKEASFYVDIDKGNRKIHKPEIEISNEECIRRVTSLVGLYNSAFHIKDWMTDSISEKSKDAISDFAYLTLTIEMYQQDVIAVLEKMKSTNDEYNDGLYKIKELFLTKIENE
jgi:AbiV family abortive infection protein